jgi:hypothetical protein
MGARTKRSGQGISAIVRPQLRAAAHFAADKAITAAKVRTQSTIKSVGLGGLANVVATQSSLKKRQTASDNAYGAIFARGRPGDSENRGEQALLAYTRGASIFPTGGKQWLAFATSAIPKRVGRRKMTPKLYMSSGLVTSIGPLVFVPVNNRVARLVVRKVEISRRNSAVRSPLLS